MREQRIGSMIVANESAVPLGIFTLRDVLDRVTLDAGAMQAPIADHMSPRPVTAEIDSGAYQVALTMIRYGVNHVVLVRDGRLAGLVSARDLFGLQSATLRQLSTAIRSARDLAQIEAYGRDIAELARKMLAQGVATGPLSAFIASLNDLLTQRIVEIEFHGIDARYCWILMGSEGRSEQTLVTDQDNGLIFAPAAGVSPEDTRPKLLAICQRVNHALDRAGYQLCPGDIMAGNPQWCLTLDEWQVKFGRWIDSGSPDALLHGSIFFDLRPLQGDLALAQQLRQWLIQHAARNPRFLHQMAANALRNRPHDRSETQRHHAFCRCSAHLQPCARHRRVQYRAAAFRAGAYAEDPRARGRRVDRRLPAHTGTPSALPGRSPRPKPQRGQSHRSRNAQCL
jgi:CBS domain-containing protein